MAPFNRFGLNDGLSGVCIIRQWNPKTGHVVVVSGAVSRGRSAGPGPESLSGAICGR